MHICIDVRKCETSTLEESFNQTSQVQLQTPSIHASLGSLINQQIANVSNTSTSPNFNAPIAPMPSIDTPALVAAS